MTPRSSLSTFGFLGHRHFSHPWATFWTLRKMDTHLAQQWFLNLARHERVRSLIDFGARNATKVEILHGIVWHPPKEKAQPNGDAASQDSKRQRPGKLQESPALLPPLQFAGQRAQSAVRTGVPLRL